VNADNRKLPLVLMILDGWGFDPDSESNAITLAQTPCWDKLNETCPSALLETSGVAVGLPAGQMGNSEVGHMNIGAGRIVYQDFTRIEKAIEDGSFADNSALCEAIDAVHDHNGRLHIMGLLSPGGVHSHENQFIETIKLAARQHDTAIDVHVFLDGRDTPPKSAGKSILRLEAALVDIPAARIATVTGRYYAMDRDTRWDRVRQAYVAIAQCESQFSAETAIQALHDAYDRGESDEFVLPTTILGKDCECRGVNNGDAVIFVNFRADRAREISLAFVDPDFTGFERPLIELSKFVSMTQYLDGLPASVAFPPSTLPLLLAEILAKENLRQLRIAETEKYAHVTFFFNGGIETPVAGEERILIPSPRVDTYDLQPEMSAPQLTVKLVDAIESGTFDVIICNVANPDMVGHTGVLSAAILAVEAVDRCLGAHRAPGWCREGRLPVPSVSCTILPI
jgi:2,3-bisphosphoglycerate-independent phosphoglycerate mutase